MKRVTIEETDIDDEGKEVVIDSETLNLCNECVNDYASDSDTVSIEDTSYDGDCDDCGKFEEGVWKNE